MMTSYEKEQCMQTYLIIADDFTGANDTGLQLVRRGVPTRVQIGHLRELPARYSLVLDTESRNLGPQKQERLSGRPSRMWIHPHFPSS
jgi:uncharacterized protein YgbK (DUF1537 family)